MERSSGSADHQLLLAQAGWVQGLARNLISDPAGAEDVAQDTMLAALTAAPLAGDDERTLRAWLARVATNLAHLTRRRTTRRQQREQWAAQPDVVDSAADAVERASQLQLVIDGVMGLEEPYRSAVLLRYYDGLTPAEIADRTGATPVAVRKRISRGLERLRERMDREHGGDRSAWAPAMLAFAEAPNALTRALAEGGVTGAGTVAASPLPLAAAALVAAGALTLAGLSVFARAPRAPQAIVPTVAVVAPELSSPAAFRRPVQSASPLDFARILPTGTAESWHDQPRTTALEQEPSNPAAIAPRVRGRVVDLFGVGLAGVPLVSTTAPGEVLGVSDWEGSFELEWSAEAPARIDLADSGFVALRSPLVDPASLEAQPARLVVATRAVEVAGWVSDPRGRPVEGARLRVRVPAEAFLQLGLPLDATLPATIEVESDREGRFDLGRVPALECAMLETRATGFEPDLRSAPLAHTPGLSIRLAPRAPAADFMVEGLVVFRSGEPAPDAVVQLGPRTARTDARGRFELPAAPGPSTLTAKLEGWEAASVSLGGGASEEGPRRLALGARLFSITGKVVSPSGAPLSGWVVTAGPSPGVTPSGPTPGAASSSQSGGKTVSGAHGGFTLTGLHFGSYEVWAVDPATLEVASTSAVLAGQGSTVVRTGGPGSGPTIAGQVLDPRGLPRPGELVTAAVFVPGQESAVVSGPTTLSGPGGRFKLGVGGSPYVRVVVAGAQPVQPSGPPGSYAATVVLPPVAHFVFDGSAWILRPESLSMLDEDGDVLELQTPAGPARRAPLYDGLSLVLGTTEAARTVVLYHDGRELIRLPVQLLGGEVTTLGPGDFTVGVSAALQAAGGLGGSPGPQLP